MPDRYLGRMGEQRRHPAIAGEVLAGLELEWRPALGDTFVERRQHHRHPVGPQLRQHEPERGVTIEYPAQHELPQRFAGLVRVTALERFLGHAKRLDVVGWGVFHRQLGDAGGELVEFKAFGQLADHHLVLIGLCPAPPGVDVKRKAQVDARSPRTARSTSGRRPGAP